ncbi:MAG TPA: hydratase, partial [Spirochaeta sp.]|nr:hydratase [Spirochaeta sp.]
IAYHFSGEIYENRVKSKALTPTSDEELVFGPNIKDWPQMIPLTENLLLQFAAVINDPVTTTDELIPSGETSSFRSNPLRLAEFTLSRRDPEYVGRAKGSYKTETDRREDRADAEFSKLIERINKEAGKCSAQNTGTGSLIFANKPGDGSAREQAASCQKVLGGWANIAVEYATKRYRSNLINWGILPFTVDKSEADFNVLDYIFVPNIREALQNKKEEMKAFVISAASVKEITLYLKDLTDSELDIIVSGCLINYYSDGK